MKAEERERELEKLLARLMKKPFAKEYQELGRLLMKHIDDFTPAEMKRYNELTEILNQDK